MTATALSLTWTVPELTGSCALARCNEEVTGQIVGAEPPVLVCESHTAEVKRVADYEVRPIPELTVPAPELTRED